MIELDRLDHPDRAVLVGTVAFLDPGEDRTTRIAVTVKEVE